MGGEAPGRALIDDAAISREIQRVTAETAASAERSLRSLRVSAVALLPVAVLGLLSLRAASARPLVGELSLRDFALLTSVTWGCFALASSTYRVLGPHHRISRLAAWLDEVTRSVALMVALAFSGSAAGLFLLVSISRGFAGRAQPPMQQRRTWAAQALGHAAVGGTCLVIGRPTTAMLVALAFGTFAIAYGMTARAQQAALRVRVERDLFERALHGVAFGDVRSRMAREIHDGVGADLLALALQLRRAGREDPEAEALSREAQQILEDLRGVVWTLRGTEGTLGELEKLVHARCARVCEGVAYQRLLPEAVAHQPVPSASALALLRVAPEVVRLAVFAARPSKLEVSLSATPGLELAVLARGATQQVGDSALVESRNQLQAQGAALEVTFPAGGADPLFQVRVGDGTA